MKRLLIVHHTPSPTLQAMYEAVRAGATADEIEGVEVVARPALTATAVDVLEADGYLHGNNDATGALRALESITTGLKWRAARPPVVVTGEPGKADLEECWELGARAYTLGVRDRAGLVVVAYETGLVSPGTTRS
jgi:hypothetical protein